jgi:hypothetical protein
LSAAPLSLIYRKFERRSAHRSQLKIRAPLLQSRPACERSLRAEHKRAPLINALLILKIQAIFNFYNKLQGIRHLGTDHFAKQHQKSFQVQCV